MTKAYRVGDVVFDLDANDKPEAQELLGRWLHYSKDHLPELVTENPFAERIGHLIDHPNFARKKSTCPRGSFEEPNCMGTALWIARLSDRDEPCYAMTSEVKMHLNGDHRKIPGSFVITWQRGKDLINHMGVYLGMLNNLPVMFAQHGPKGDFVYEVYYEGANWKKSGLTKPKHYVPGVLGV